MAKVPKKQTAQPPALDTLLKPAVGIALAMLAYYFMKGVTNEITRIDVNDSLALREVFFGEGALGKDYAVSFVCGVTLRCTCLQYQFLFMSTDDCVVCSLSSC